MSYVPTPYPYIDDLSDEELYVLSTIGKGPKGDKGDSGSPTQEQVKAALEAIIEEHPEYVTTVEDHSISTIKLADNAVTHNKMADRSVGSDELIDGSVTTDKLADAGVTTAKLANGSVTTAKLANGSVTRSKLDENTLPTMSSSIRGIARVGAGLAMNGDMIELDGSGDVSTAVTNWLNAHPEAVTTVEDDSVTDAKLVQTGGILSKVRSLTLADDDYDFGFCRGTLDDDHTIGWSNTRIISSFIPCRIGDMYQVIDDNYDISAHEFDHEKTWIGSIAGGWTRQKVSQVDGFVRIIVRKTDNSIITRDEVDGIKTKVRVYSCAAASSKVKYAITQNSGIVNVWANINYNIDSNQWVENYNRICTQLPITSNDDLLISADDGYKVSVVQFDGEVAHSNHGWSSSNYIPRGTTFLANFARTDDSEISPDESEHIRFDSVAPIGNMSDEPLSVGWLRGTVNADGGASPSNNGMRLSKPQLFPTRIEIGTGARIVLRLHKNGVYLGKINSSNVLDRSDGNWRHYFDSLYVDNIVKMYGADSVDFSISPTDGTDLTQMSLEDAVSWADGHCTIYADRHIQRDWFFDTYGDKNVSGTVVGIDLIKRGIRTSLLGEVAGYQAFCRKGGKYYSTDGSKVYRQDSSFATETSVDANVGHGNSMQLGSSGDVAYVSGWDDNKVYVVDLLTMSVSDVIDLPTTGYTTVAVDDVAGIMYIFQRDTRPSTVDTYNLITYDYVNSQILSTRKLSKRFGAMQSCDYLNGRIAVLYGLSTQEVPSGMFVCDTHGDILAEYDLDMLHTTEPEGICIDRDDNELLISLVDRKLYKVSTIF